MIYLKKFAPSGFKVAFGLKKFKWTTGRPYKFLKSESYKPAAVRFFVRITKTTVDYHEFFKN